MLGNIEKFFMDQLLKLKKIFLKRTKTGIEAILLISI